MVGSPRIAFRNAFAVASRLVRNSTFASKSSASSTAGSSHTDTMMPRSSAFSFGMSPARTASSTPCAIAACTVPIRMFVYLLLVTVTLLTMIVAGFTCTSLLRIANTFVCPFTCSPMRCAIAMPTGPSSSPITTSGSAADHA